jgi:5-methylcytosine-specific restriction endonuclease McrA
MKNIVFTGKRNIDKINKVEKPLRNVIKDYKFSKDFSLHQDQIILINKLILDEKSNDLIQLKKILEDKRKSYYYQDIQKNIYDESKFITIDKLIELLVISKLKCNYCCKQCYLIYKEVLFNNQWTLDRIDNNFGHNFENVVISCLKCNLQRKDMDYERFHWGKKLKIKKT